MLETLIRNDEAINALLDFCRAQRRDRQLLLLNLPDAARARLVGASNQALLERLDSNARSRDRVWRLACQLWPALANERPSVEELSALRLHTWQGEAVRGASALAHISLAGPMLVRDDVRRLVGHFGEDAVAWAVELPDADLAAARHEVLGALQVESCDPELSLEDVAAAVGRLVEAAYRFCSPLLSVLIDEAGPEPRLGRLGWSFARLRQEEDRTP